MYFAKDMVKCISLMDNEWYLCSHISKIPMPWQVRKKRKDTGHITEKLNSYDLFHYRWKFGVMQLEKRLVLDAEDIEIIISNENKLKKKNSK